MSYTNNSWIPSLALDFRESGDSEPVSKPYTLGDLADDAVTVLKARVFNVLMWSASRWEEQSRCMWLCVIPKAWRSWY